MSVTTSQATTLLENVLFEQPTVAAANAATWVAASNISSESTVAGLAAAMASSAEGQIAEQVVRYYMGALGRVPSGSEIQFYVKYAEQGLSAADIALGSSAVPVATWSQIADFFANSPEFSHDYGITSPGSVNATNEGLVITAFYTNVLNRAPSSSEITFYENALNSGTSVQTLIQYFTNSPEYQNEVNGGLGTALASYGTSVVNGNAPTTIPFFLPGQVLTETLTASALTVTGTSASTTVTVTGTAAQSAQSAVTAVTGVFGIAGVTAATGVQGVTGVTQVTPVAGQTAQTAVTDGAVTINDANSSATGTGTIATVTLIDSGAGSVINDNALATLTLTGTTGTLAITNSNTAAIAAHGSTLALTLNGLSAVANTITDTNNEISTLNVTTATADSVLAGFTDSHLASLTVAGANKLTLGSINASLTSLTVSGAASFSDGAHIHGTGLAALGSALAISITSTGTFAAVLDDTTQTFTGGAGADTITVSALTDATKTITAGSATNNEIIFEGGNYALTSASSGNFVNFQTVGVAGDVTGTIDLSVIDATASTLEVLGANNNIVFTKAAKGAALLLDPSAGAYVTVSYADSTGASDSAAVTMSSAVQSLTLHDAAGVGVATLTITNNLASSETLISAAHTIGSLTDNGLATLNVSGSAGLTVSILNETSTMATGFTLNNSSTDGNGVTIGALNDSALASLAFTGSGVSNVTLNTSAASFAVTNNGTTLDSIGTLTDAGLTSLTLAANVALGQWSTPLTTNGLQDSSTAGVTVSGASDNAHVTVNLTAGAASGKTDSITLGNGNNVVIDASSAGTVNVTLGTGANLVELGTGSLDTTAHYTVTLATRTATPPNAIYVGAAGTNYASAPSAVISGATTGDIIAFGNDASSLGGGALTATSLTGQSSVAGAIAALETAVSGTQHKVAYGVYGGNTYIVETTTGTVGATDTAVIEVTGSQTLFASVGYVTIGTVASPSPGGSLSGAGFTIPAGTVSTPNPLLLGNNGNVVTMVGATAGITDTFQSGINAGALTINYQATAASTGTDTIQMSGSQGANKSDVTGLTVNDTSSGSAGVTIGAFTDNSLSTATYNNSAATGATMTQSALTSSSLTTINLTGGVSLEATNAYFITANLSTANGVTINDSNIGSGTTTMGLTLAGGPSAVTLNMTGPGTLATGTLADDNLTNLTIQGGGTGAVNIGALTDAYAGASGFTVTDTSTSTGGTVMILSGLSKAVSLTVNDSSAGALTDSSAYNDPLMTSMTLNDTGTAALSLGTTGITVNALTSLTLKNTSSTALTVGTAGITADSLTSVTLAGSGTGTIVTGQITDSVSTAFTLTDQSSSTSAATLDLSLLSAASTVTVNDSAAGALTVGNISDATATAMSFSNSGSALLTVTSVTAPDVTGASATTSLTFANSNSGSLSVGAVSAATLTNLAVTASGSGALTLASLSVPLATSISLTNNGSSTLNVTGAITSNVLSTLTIAGGASGTLSLGSLTDNVTTGFTLNDSSANSAGFTLNVAALPTAAAIIVNDSAKGPLTIGALAPATSFADPDAATLTFNNTSTAQLTVNDIVDDASAVTMTIESMQGSTSVASTGSDLITLDNGGAGASFSLIDSSASSGTATVTYNGATTAGPGTFSVTDSAVGALTISAFVDNDLTAATLYNSGAATLTIQGISNTTASGATLFATLTLGDSTLGGSGKIALTNLTLLNDTGPVAISNYQTGNVTIGTLTLGSLANPSGGLTLTDNAGAGVLAIGANASLSPVFVTSITIADNSSSGAINAFLNDSATATTAVGLTGSGAQSLTLTDSAATLNVTLSGTTNTLALTQSSATNIVNLTIGTGTNTISLSAHTAQATFDFSAASASNLNVSPVTADKISGFVLDGGSVGDALHIPGFTSANVILATDANSYTSTGVWTSTGNGILTQSGASVLNFITDVQNVTQANNVTGGTPGIAAFLDVANNNTWIAYNDGAGHVGVIELVGVLATGGIESSGTAIASAVHLT